MKRIGLLLTQCVLLVGAVRRTRLTWVNGIGYNAGHMQADAPEISRFFGGKKVDFYHNPTAMANEDDLAGYYRDLSQATAQKLGRITAEVNGLVQHLREALEEVGKRGRVIHIAHSQGALLTFLACKQLLPREMKQIEVLAFGGAAALRSTPETPFIRCVNYYSVNDPLLFVVPSAEQALRSGFMLEEFCFLAPRVGDPIADHHLLGPTYATALAYEGTRFQRHYQGIVYRVVRSILLFFLALANVIHRGWLYLASMTKKQIQAVVHRAFLFLQIVWSLMERKRIEIAPLEGITHTSVEATKEILHEM